jgi:hypothetical protein
MQWVVDALPGLLAQLGGLVGSVLDAIGRALPGIIEALAAWGAKMVAWVLEALPGLLQDLGVLALAMLDWIIERIPIIAEQLGTWAVAFVEWIGPVAANLLLILGDMLGQLLNWLAEKLPFIVAELSKWGAAFGDWVMNAAMPALLKGLAAIGTVLVNWIGEVGVGLGRLALLAGSDLAASIGNGILNGTAALFRSVMFVAGSIGLFLTSIVNDAMDAGRNVVFGLANGMIERWNNLIQTVDTLFGGLVRWIKSLLGIASPSKVAAEMGSFFTQGLSQGMDSQVGLVYDAAERLAGAMQLPLSQVATTSPGAGGSTMNSTVTNSNTFNQYVTSSAPSDQTIANFGLLAAMANGTVSG